MPRATDNTFPVSEDGHLPRSARQFIAGQLALYAGRDVRVRLSSPKRSTQANAYYWGCVIKPIHTALTLAGVQAGPQDVHEHFKRKYLQPRIIEVFGTTHVVPPSTSDLDSTDFFEYVEAVRTDEDVLALGVYIDDPDPEYASYKLSEVA